MSASSTRARGLAEHCSRAGVSEAIREEDLGPSDTANSSMSCSCSHGGSIYVGPALPQNFPHHSATLAPQPPDLVNYIVHVPETVQYRWPAKQVEPAIRGCVPRPRDAREPGPRARRRPGPRFPHNRTDDLGIPAGHISALRCYPWRPALAEARRRTRGDGDLDQLGNQRMPKMSGSIHSSTYTPADPAREDTP